MFSTQQYFGFDPRTIPGCELWLDAADSNTIQYASGSNISNWIDKSGNGRNFSNANAGTQPTLETSGLSGTARHVLFNTTNAGYLTNSTFSGFSNTTFDVYSVLRLGTGGTVSALFWGQPASLQMIIALGNGADAGNNYAFHTSGTWRLAPQEGFNSTAFANIYQFYSTGTQIGRRYQGYDFNGLTNQVATYSFPGFSASELTFFRPVSGAWSGAPLRVGEVILFNRVLTASERQQMEGYLGWKWGIQTRFTNTTSFSPTSIAGCQLWLDAADSATFTPSTPSNGALISQWNDKSGNARHVSNATTASQPRYRVGSNVTNGYPTVHFDSTSATATNRGLLTNSTFTGLNTSNWDVFAAMSIRAPGSTALIWDDPSSLQHIIACYTNGSTTRNDILHTSGTWRLTPVTGYIEPDTPRIVETYSTGTQVGRRVNGYFYGNVTDQSANYAFPSRTGNRPFFIANPTGGWSTGNLYVSELIIYNSVLSDSDRSNVQNYLRAKWGITDGIIPTSHPLYYNPAAMRIFQPIDIGMPEFWFDAADMSTITTSPSFIWSNKGSAVGSNITVFSGTPISGTVRQNDRNLVSLSNGTQLIFTGAFPTQVRTRFIATRPTSSSETSLLFQNRSPTSGNDYLGVGTTMLEVAQGVSNTMISSTISSQSNIFNVYTFMNASTTGSNRLAITGSNLTLTTSVAASGYNTASATNYINHTNSQDLGEWISYNRQLTAAEIAQVEGYLAAKWGLSGSLPTTQPYYLQRALPSTPLFTPTAISNCNLWLDAMDTSTFTPANPANGTGITAWSDKSGSNFTFSRTLGTTNATYNAASNSLFFSTSNAGYSSSHPASVTNETLFMVVTSTLSNSVYVVGATGSGGRQAGFYADWTRIGNINSQTEWGAITAPGSVVGGARILAISTVSSSSNLAVSANAGSFVTATLANPLGSNARTSTLAAEATSPTYGGHIHEIIAYTRVLSTSERQLVEGYLAWKWGIRNNYATTHPYYKFRP